MAPEAWIEGHCAFEDGEDIKNNPYGDEDVGHIDWISGWQAAQKQREFDLYGRGRKDVSRIN